MVREYYCPACRFQPGHRHIVLGAKMVILSGSAEEFCNCCVHSCSALSALPARHACVNSAASATKPASRRSHSVCQQTEGRTAVQSAAALVGLGMIWWSPPHAQRTSCIPSQRRQHVH